MTAFREAGEVLEYLGTFGLPSVAKFQDGTWVAMLTYHTADHTGLKVQSDATHPTVLAALHQLVDRLSALRDHMATMQHRDPDRPQGWGAAAMRDVTVTVSGPVGSGKSAVLAEIESVERKLEKPTPPPMRIVSKGAWGNRELVSGSPEYIAAMDGMRRAGER